MDIAKTYARIFGFVALLIGILGFVPGISSGGSGSGYLLGIFAINPLHNMIHIVTGLVAIFAGYYANGSFARMYALVFGLVYALVTVLGFTPLVMDGSLLGLIPVNMADNILGKVTHLGGKIKEGIGELLGDRSIEREGRLDQMEGRAEQDAARAEDALLDADARRAAAQRAKDLNRDL